MCLTPTRIRTNAKYFSLGSFRRLYIDIPCGHCAECQQQKKNEWYLRNYFEAEDTWSKGGYILFETLTYDDEHLPNIAKVLTGIDLAHEKYAWLKVLDWITENELWSDNPKKDPSITSEDFNRIHSALKANNYSCFNYPDFQKFMKRLRMNLTRAGFNPDSCLRYFMCSEYGHDELYVDDCGRQRQGTFRPHYHVLFYSTDPKLDPLTLSRFVRVSWKNGRTHYDKGRSFVYNNVFGPRYIKDPKRLRGVQYYVTKYVCKDYEFEEKVDERICNNLRTIYQYPMNSKEYADKRREFHRFMDQFHRQSVGFGAQALESEAVIKSIWSEGNISIPDSQKVVKKIPVPMYYVRKLFQVCAKDSEGTLHWNWTDVGRKWKQASMERCVYVLSTKMKDWYDNLETVLGSEFEAKARRRKVDSILGSRTWKDYAEYIVYYKDRVFLDAGSVSKENILSNSLMPVDEDATYNLYKSPQGYYTKDIDGNVYDVSVDDLLRYSVVDDTISGEFGGFDLLCKIYKASMIMYNNQKQAAYDFKLAQSKKMKSLGFRTKVKV